MDRARYDDQIQGSFGSGQIGQGSRKYPRPDQPRIDVPREYRRGSGSRWPEQGGARPADKDKKPTRKP